MKQCETEIHFIPLKGINYRRSNKKRLIEMQFKKFPIDIAFS